MAYRKKAYTLKEEITKNGTRYFIGFKDRQGNCHELEVSKQFFIEFRQIEGRNGNLQQWDCLLYTSYSSLAHGKPYPAAYPPRDNR